MTQCIAKAEHLKMYYQKIRAVEDVSFELYEGEILAVIGPNGSGKTTTVECLEGLRKPTGGHAEVFGLNPCQERKQLYTRLGIQLQAAEYPANIKVKELCILFSSFYTSPADWKELLRQFQLENKAGRMVSKLSGGEKQRLSILLALLPNPKLLVLDELTTGLDPEMKHSIWEILKQIRGLGTSILLVSHYMDEVEALADRLLFLKNGKMCFLGTMEEFHIYAAERIPTERKHDNMTLEELYLLLAPSVSTTALDQVIK